MCGARWPGVVPAGLKTNVMAVTSDWFATLADVPTRAISMSVRRILASRTIVCSVPDRRKAEAVQAAVEGPVTPEVPASILQRHPRCFLHLDREAAALLQPASPRSG